VYIHWFSFLISNRGGEKKKKKKKKETEVECLAVDEVMWHF
jgi:hypothetical protein